VCLGEFKPKDHIFLKTQKHTVDWLVLVLDSVELQKPVK
jgi:hypothetical protein